MKRSQLKTAAVILAAGNSRRMGADINKLFCKIYGKTVIAHTVEVFEQTSNIDKVFIVSSEENMQFIRDEMLIYNFKKVDCIFRGGTSRTESVKNAIDQIKGFDKIVIHDGARPLVTEDIINKTLSASLKTGAAITGFKSFNTVKLESEGFVEATLNRERVWQIQTPQVFDEDILKKAYKNPENTTDDAALIEKLGIKVTLSQGSRENIKITTPLDLFLAEAILKYRGNL